MTDLEQAPPSAQGFRILRRPNILSDDPDAFIADLGGILRGIAAKTGAERQAEPQRLFVAKEYRAAVISAMTLLEAKLRERLNKIPWPQTRRPLSMRSLIDQAVEQSVLPQTSRIRVDSWMRTRNEVVHSAMPISRAQAEEIVSGVMELLGQL
jgi:hypothetical protein